MVFFGFLIVAAIAAVGGYLYARKKYGITKPRKGTSGGGGGPAKS